MTRLGTFRAAIYNDRESEIDEGVVDISAALITKSNPFAASRLAEPAVWDSARRDNVVIFDTEPALYLIRCGTRDAGGKALQTSAVVGIAGIVTELQSDPKVVSVADPAFEQLLQPAGAPLLRASTASGHFRVWPLRQAGTIQIIADAIENSTDLVMGLMYAAATGPISIPRGLLFAAPQHVSA